MYIYIYGIPHILPLVAFGLALRVIEMMSICIYLSLCVYFKKAVWNGGLSFNNQSKPQNSGFTP